MKLLISAVILMMSFKGDAQSLSCDSNITQPLCPGTITKCTCAITSLVVTRWNFTTLNQCPDSSNLISLTQLAPCSISTPSSSGTCGPYLSAANNNPIMASSSCPTSTLNITANQALNGLTIECRDAGSGNPGTLVGTGTISITAPPSPPNITVSEVLSTTFTVTWTSVPTATSYNVSVNDSTPISLPPDTTIIIVIISNNNIIVSIPSTGAKFYVLNLTNRINSSVYTVSVVAINCAGSSSPAKMTAMLSAASSPSAAASSPSGNIAAIMVAVLVNLAVLLM